MKVTTIRQLGLDEKYHLDVEWKAIPDIRDLNTVFASGAIEFNNDASLTISSQARVAGRKIIWIDAGSCSSNAIIVRKDSPYNSLIDLKSKTLGTFTVPSGGLAYGAEMLAREGVMFNPSKDVTIVRGSQAVLLDRLVKGDIDAAEESEPFISQALYEGKARVLVSNGDASRKLFGIKAVVEGLGAQEEYAQKNPNVAKRVVSMFREALNYVLTHRDVVRSFVQETTGVKEPALVERITDTVLDDLRIPEWNSNTARAIEDTLKNIHVKYGVVPQMPTGLFSLDYV